MKIESLWTYPVKSCAGTQHQKIEVTRGGFKWDRHWMIVDEKGHFLTQRQLPKMALIRTQLTDTALILEIDNYIFEVPFKKELKESCQVKVWKSEVEALPEDPLIDQQLSVFLERPARLVRSPKSQRQYDIDFADGRPLQLANMESLKEFNQQLSKPITMDRFRANIVVSGLPAFTEDHLTDFTLGQIQLQFSKLCARCNIINVDPKTGIRNNSEPLEKLKAFHPVGNQAIFGALLVPKNTGTLHLD